MAELFPYIRPVLHALPAEPAHGLTLAALAMRPAARRPPGPDGPLNQVLWGRHFAHPIGLAAGFDKNARVPAAALGLGFAFVEVGTVTPRPQPGNPKPRLVRLPADRGLVNRLGFNNAGLRKAVERLRVARAAGQLAGPVGLNVGMNKTSAAAGPDYLAGVEAGLGVADYLVVNISSPNTPGLRDLQDQAALERLLGELLARRRQRGAGTPLLVKIAPDLDADGLAALSDTCLAAGVDGLICTNTTTQRPASLRDPQAAQAGGLSGRPLFGPATATLSTVYTRTQGRLPLIGVGGVESVATAYAKIRAGASLLQLYTALTYQGPGLVRRLTDGLARRITEAGFASLAEAVGADHR